MKAAWLVAGVLGASLCSPGLAVAQSGTSSGNAAAMSPAQIYDGLLSRTENEIVPAADAMPEDKFNFAPTNGEFTGVNTFAATIKHLAQANYMFFGRFGDDKSAEMKSIEKLTSKADLMKALKDSFAFAHQQVGTITAQNAFEPLGPNKGTRAGITTMALAHANDHYGQMVEYLRMNGIIPPASRKKS